ncbi:MAG: CDP-alcohol phosphatidyltransferase family protein [Deltaproteobacteria bacterium]|nr:CDP-alcohol phosphatidyltransferase family protein [Deltaproteobacteria bacterium]
MALDLFAGYRKSCKPPEVEEPPDVAFNRPLGYLLVRALFKTPVTPNQLTFLGLCVGLTSAFFYLQYGYASLVVASIFILLYCVIDCSDGQMARLKKMNSRYGRTFDGLVDHIVGITTAMAGSAYAAWHSGDPIYYWLGALALGSAILHNAAYDYYKNTFIRMTRNDYREGDTWDEIKADYERVKAKGDQPVILFLLGAYRSFLVVQNTLIQLFNRGAAKSSSDYVYTEETAKRYYANNRMLMRIWSNFGVSTHVVLIAFAGFINRVEWYIILRLVGFNVAMVVLAMFQRRASRLSLVAPSAPARVKA